MKNMIALGGIGHESVSGYGTAAHQQSQTAGIERNTQRFQSIRTFVR